MQTTDKHDLAQRPRYYQATMDVENIERGAIYKNMKDNYVIFICTFDPFKEGLPIYTFENRCVENPNKKLNDGTQKIFLNTTATTNLDAEVKAFYDYIRQGNGKSQFTKNI